MYRPTSTPLTSLTLFRPAQEAPLLIHGDMETMNMGSALVDLLDQLKMGVPKWVLQPTQSGQAAGLKYADWEGVWWIGKGKAEREVLEAMQEVKGEIKVLYMIGARRAQSVRSCRDVI
jgi:hypothetical protein